MLTDVPNGVSCFIDATILYYHLVGNSPLSDDCSDFLKRIEIGKIRGHTSSIVVSEATHKVMLAEVVHRHKVDHKGLIARIKRHPELLDGLSEHKMVSTTVHGLHVTIEHAPLDVLTRAAEISSQKRLLTNDAIALAIMEKVGLNHLATNDDDFDGISGISVFKPMRS